MIKNKNIASAAIKYFVCRKHVNKLSMFVEDFLNIFK